MINKCLYFIQSWLPNTCALCQSPGHDGLDICPDCLHSLPRAEFHCPCCGIQLPFAAPLCGQCQQQTPAVDETWCLAEYSYPVPALVQGLKFRNQLSHARLLGELMARMLSQHAPLPQAIIPVPLHPQRQRQRGFNQALEIARPLARRLGIPLLPGLVRRQIETGTQSLLDAKQRKKNLNGAFEVCTTPPRRVVIVDDVITTASTINALASSLKAAGACHVSAWSVARA